MESCCRQGVLTVVGTVVDMNAEECYWEGGEAGKVAVDLDEAGEFGLEVVYECGTVKARKSWC